MGCFVYLFGLMMFTNNKDGRKYARAIASSATDSEAYQCKIILKFREKRKKINVSLYKFYRVNTIQVNFFCGAEMQSCYLEPQLNTASLISFISREGTFKIYIKSNLKWIKRRVKATNRKK